MVRTGGAMRCTGACADQAVGPCEHGAAGAGALCGRARRGLEATPGRGGRPRGRWSFGRLGFGARGCAGAARRPASFFLCVPCCWVRDCAVPGGRAPPLGRRRTRARGVRSRGACVGGCARPTRAGWGRGRVGAYIAGFRKGAAAAGIRGGGSRVGGRMLDGR